MHAEQQHPTRRPRRTRHQCAAVLVALAAIGAAATFTGARGRAGVLEDAAAAVGATGSTGASGSTGVSGATGPSAAPDPRLSGNWSGYVAGGRRGVRHFTTVSTTFVQPQARCAVGAATFSSFWVGLGGSTTASTQVEQAGTDADCDRSGNAHYSAWYELAPAGPVTLHFAIAPGDRMGVRVSLRRGHVVVTMYDRTRGTSIRRRVRAMAPDSSSAEWIAEAPSSCLAAGFCMPLPLTNFGSVTFSSASTATRARHHGSIANPDWGRRPVKLKQRVATRPGAGPDPRRLVTASPSVLGPQGSSFTITWR